MPFTALGTRGHCCPLLAIQPPHLPDSGKILGLLDRRPLRTSTTVPARGPFYLIYHTWWSGLATAKSAVSGDFTDLGATFLNISVCDIEARCTNYRRAVKCRGVFFSSIKTIARLCKRSDLGQPGLSLVRGSRSSTFITLCMYSFLRRVVTKVQVRV